jgi:hypothetical protein
MKKITVINPAPPAQLNDDRPVLRVAAYARVSTEEDEQKTALRRSVIISRHCLPAIPSGSMPAFIMTRALPVRA